MGEDWFSCQVCGDPTSDYRCNVCDICNELTCKDCECPDHPCKKTRIKEKNYSIQHVRNCIEKIQDPKFIENEIKQINDKIEAHKRSIQILQDPKYIENEIKKYNDQLEQHINDLKVIEDGPNYINSEDENSDED